MKILSRNSTPLKSSFNLSEDGKKFIYQANTEIYVEGNPYLNLFTPETVFDLECEVSNMENIQKVTDEQVSKFVSEKYKI